MLIVLEDDVFDEIENAKSSYDDVIQAVDRLFDGMYMGKHLVFTKLNNLNKIKNNSLFSPRTIDFTQWISRKYSQIYSCKDLVEAYISVSTKYKKVARNKTKNFIEVPIKFVIDISATKLLTENESDAKFYEMLAKYVFNKKGKGYCTFKYEKESYHGGNGFDTIVQVAENDGFALILVDSDMDYPEGKHGTTYKKVNEAYKNIKDKIPVEMVVLPVREKENLIPASIYNRISDCGLVKVISDKFSDNEVITNFFDIKDGVKYKKINNHTAKWEEYYGELLSECKKQHVCNAEETDNMDKYFVSGIGGKLCDVIATLLFEEKTDISGNNQLNCYSDEQVNEFLNNRDAILESLPEFIFNNWEYLANKIFSWGCCIDVKAYPAQRKW